MAVFIMYVLHSATSIDKGQLKCVTYSLFAILHIYDLVLILPGCSRSMSVVFHSILELNQSCNDTRWYQ